MVDITGHLNRVISGEGVKEGIVTVFVPHTTAGITINENADPDVQAEMLSILDKIVPCSGSYRHMEGNSDAHLKSSMMGHSVTVILKGGELMLGTWQGIYFCEFDGPRSREVWVDVRR